MKTGGSYRRIILDEALMLHAGEILYACALAKVNEALLIGDTKQIPYINRTAHNTQYHDIMQHAVITQTLNHSYRITSSVATFLSKFYNQSITTSNPIKDDTRLVRLENIDQLHLKINRSKHKILVFKQSEKLILGSLGYDVSTVHEYQGKQAEHIAVVRTSNKPEDEIYTSQPHCIVAISRHTKSLTYLTPMTSDTLSTWINQINNFSTPQIAAHQRDTTENPPALIQKLSHTNNTLNNSCNIASYMATPIPERETCQQTINREFDTPLKNPERNHQFIVKAQVHHPDTYSPPAKLANEQNNSNSLPQNKAQTASYKNKNLSIVKQTNRQTHIPFLEASQKKKVRMKVQRKTRIFINSVMKRIKL